MKKELKIPLMSDSISDQLLEESEAKKKAMPANPESLMFFCLGNTSLLCFNIIINAIDIYNKLTGRTDMAGILNRTYNFPNALMALLLCFFKPTNYKISIIFALGSLSFIMCFLPIFILIDIDDRVMFYLTLSIIGLTGVISSLLFSSVFSMASQFSPVSSAMASSGCGCCGVLASVLRIITKAIAATGKANLYSTAAYFFISAAIIFFTLIFFIVKIRNPEIKEKLVPKVEEKVSIFSRETITVIKSIWVSWLSVFANFLITLSIFPGYVTGTYAPPKIRDWTPVIVVAIFCVFDWVGRAGPGLKVWPPRLFAWIPIVLRFFSFPIFIFSIQKRFKAEPWWTFAWMIPFAISNGYFGTVQIIYGSNPDELNSEQKKFAGFIISFAVNAGILCAMGLTFLMPKPPEYNQ